MRHFFTGQALLYLELLPSFLLLSATCYIAWKGNSIVRRLMRQKLSASAHISKESYLPEVEEFLPTQTERKR